MIIANLMGGMGNQMFQYAFGRALSIRHNVPLKLDIAFLNDRSPKENFTYRDFALNVFKIHAEIATEAEVKPFIKKKESRLLNYAMLLLRYPGYQLYLREPHFHFFPFARKAGKNTYIDGYWQSEKYFLEARRQLLIDFTPTRELSRQASDLMQKMSTQNSVSVHVRRGDYFTNAHINKYHGTLEADYYRRAMSEIHDRIDSPVFYLFSDQPEWFKTNVKTDWKVISVSDLFKNADHEELMLMASCKNNIIANSSFSWWGAWLNQNPDKIVIGPKDWFKETSKNTFDLLPVDWIKI